MKNFIQFLALAGLVGLVSCNEQNKDKVQGMDMGKLYVSKAKPQPGETIKIKYSGDVNDKTEATVNYLVNADHYPVDIEFKDSANSHYASLQIPDTVHAIAFNFKNGDTYEANERKGYVMPLYNENAEEIKGSSAARGLYFTSQGDRYNLKMEADSAIAMIEKDLEKHPALVSEYEGGYSRALIKADKKKGTAFIDNRIYEYLGKDSLTGKDYEALADLYYIKGAEKENDSISKIAIENFPNSDLAQRELMMKAVMAKDQQEKIKSFDEFEKLEGGKQNYRNVILRYIGTGFAKENKWDEFQKYAEKIKDRPARAGLYNTAAWDLAEKDENLELAAEMSKKSLDLIQETYGNYEHKTNYFSNKQYDKSLHTRESMYADTYAYVLYKQGKLKEAISVQEKALIENSGPEMTTRYVEYLVEAEEYEKAQEKAEQFIVDNRANSEMTEYLKTSYAKNDNSEEFDTYYAAIEEKAFKNAKEDLKNTMINEEAPAFSLTDLSGNEVELSSLKGKTVILDFWATWCGPCKMSFPGMQKAIDKYASNEKVEFLFVNTWETGDNRKEKVTEFIESNDYDFHVIMDEPVEEGSRDFNVVSEYGINGIPTKIIIGPEGNINFKKVGYSGNNEKMLKEIGIMIELTQKANEPEA